MTKQKYWVMQVTDSAMRILTCDLKSCPRRYQSHSLHQTKFYKEHLLHVKKNQEHLCIDRSKRCPTVEQYHSKQSNGGHLKFYKLLTKEPAGQDVVGNSKFKEQNFVGNSKFKE